MLGNLLGLYIPWTLLPGLIAFAVAFVLSWFLWAQLDDDKVSQKRNILTRSYVFWTWGPSDDLLTQKGRRIRRWVWFCSGIVIASAVITAIFYGRR